MFCCHTSSFHDHHSEENHRVFVDDLSILDIQLVQRIKVGVHFVVKSFKLRPTLMIAVKADTN